MVTVLCLTLFLSGKEAKAQYPGSRYYPIQQDGKVTFLLKADSASEVKVFGDFLPGVNEYNLGGSASLEKNSEGIWEYSIPAPEPNFYTYYFEVDGVRVLDPNNLKVVCNYSEFCNSFVVDGESKGEEDLFSGDRGSVTTLWYDSPGYGGKRRMNIYLPYGYSDKKTYPVLYMIPGGGDDEDTWIDMGRLPQIADRIIAEGKASPMIIVMVNSMPNQLAAPHIMNPVPGMKSHFEMMGTPQGASGGAFSEDLVETVIPFVEKNFSVEKDPSSRGICGVSMGGVYEMYILSHYPGLFGNIAFMGSGIMSPDKQAALQSVRPIKEKGYDLFWIGAGEKDMALQSAKNLMDALDGINAPYVYYNCRDGHNWRSWRNDLKELLPLLFK